MSEKASKLLDCARIAREYGVSRDSAAKWMRQLPVFDNPGGVRKVLVKRADLEALIERSRIDP